MAGPPSYKIKRVDFFGRREVPVVLQNENGPCPLLAIANVLLLRNTLQLPSGAPDVSQERLLAVVAERLLDDTAQDQHAGLPNAALEANRQQNVSDAISHLPKLTTGLDVNVRFDRGVHGFEYTNEVVVFDLLGISLVHGWLLDSGNTELVKAIRGRSYNEVVCWLINQSPSTVQRSMSAGLSGPLTDTPAVPPAPTAAPQQAGDAAALPTGDGGDSGQAAASAVAVPQGDLGEEDVDAIVSGMVAQIMGCVLSRAEKEAEPAVAAEAEAAAPPGEDHTQADDPQLSPMSSVSGLDTAELLRSAEPGAGVAAPEQESSAPAAQGADKQTAASEWEVALVQAFLDSSASQLTEGGVRSLRDTLRPNELAVFFRNNHFSTIFKHEDALYLLVTDVGFLHESDIIWERIDSAHGATSFFNSAFVPFAPHSSASTADDTAAALSLMQEAFASAPASSERGETEDAPDTDADFAMALQLQEQMEAEERELREQREAQAAQQQQQATQQRQQQQQQPQHSREQQNPMHAAPQQQRQRRQQPPRQPARQAPGTAGQARRPDKSRSMEDRMKDCAIM